jgi:transposase-like protein
MKKVFCPYCAFKVNSSGSRKSVIKAGRFWRKSDSRNIQRFFCQECLRYFSRATTHPCFRQKRRQFNHRIFLDLCSNMSMRRVAKKYGLSQNTVARKLQYLGERARIRNKEFNLSKPKALIIEFDDMETFEHTKCKPLSITLAVEHKTRRILGFEVSQMPAKGLLAKRSRKKYGQRIDQRVQGRRDLFLRIAPFIENKALFKSDQNPFYQKDVKKYFPRSRHEQHKGQRGSVVGQGELKKVRFDPLFSLNHTCAMLRANINRLIRKTWCTTKLPQRLSDHIAIYMQFHNFYLIDQHLPAG